MKRNLLYAAILILLVGLLLLIQFVQPPSFDWRKNYGPNSEQPYGNSILRDWVEDQGNFRMKPKYLAKTEDQPKAYLVFGDREQVPDSLVWKAMLKNVEQGGVLYCFYRYTPNYLEQTLDLPRLNYYSDSLPIHYSKAQGGSPQLVEPRPYDISYHYNNLFMDSLDSKYEDVKTLAWVVHNGKREPIIIDKEHGKGRIILGSSPVFFSNYYLLFRDSSPLLNALFSKADGLEKVWYTEVFNVLEEMEVRSPLRFLLETPTLRWATQLSFLFLLIYLVVMAKRKRSSLPVIKSKENRSRDFAKTIGDLYYQNSNNQQIAKKLAVHFINHARSKLYIHENLNDEKWPQKLSQREAIPENQARELQNLLLNALEGSLSSKAELKQLNRLCEEVLQAEKTTLT